MLLKKLIKNINRNTTKLRMSKVANFLMASALNA